MYLWQSVVLIIEAVMHLKFSFCWWHWQTAYWPLGGRHWTHEKEKVRQAERRQCALTFVISHQNIMLHVRSQHIQYLNVCITYQSTVLLECCVQSEIVTLFSNLYSTVLIQGFFGLMRPLCRVLINCSPHSEVEAVY